MGVSICKTVGSALVRTQHLNQGGRRTLLDGLVGEDAGGFRGVERFALPLREVPLQPGLDPAGVHRVRHDALGAPPSGRFDGEQRVRGLGLGVRDAAGLVVLFNSPCPSCAALGHPGLVVHGPGCPVAESLVEPDARLGGDSDRFGLRSVAVLAAVLGGCDRAVLLSEVAVERRLLL
jgi:hypothetical protein